ncbi:UDP-galactopyranose mutase [Enterococcus canintestini]|uniref:UDP-galactopyranose mutase n=1 Tax=Enterococcus canintestini TaxID=317010 RepID=UPI002891329E|nr:UDP-galactopyranose mutase [Enterococcus canintestini]MDT2740340.1 UDP-galactopyranose mutase [Enterococcus canintestini]
MKYLIVGAGLFGAISADFAAKQGHEVTVIDKRNHIAGNIYTEKEGNINVHKYGAHIFHTSNKKVWEFINQYAEFNRYTNSPIANYKGEIYNLPFNMNTFNKLWGVVTPKEAQEKIESQRNILKGKEPHNLEEQAISLVGTDIYTKLIKEYTEKQWGRKCTELPAFIIRRLPVRFTYDNNYFNDLYQGIPVGGYTQIVAKMLDHKNVTVKLNENFFSKKEEYLNKFDKIIYTGMIDQFYDYKFGNLEYRSLKFETEVIDEENFQGNAVVNYTSHDQTFTRIIEHKHFEETNSKKTIITREYPADWNVGDEPYYPVNDEKNSILFKKYKQLADEEINIYFGGRLGQYKYYDMDKVIEAALDFCENTIK